MDVFKTGLTQHYQCNDSVAIVIASVSEAIQQECRGRDIFNWIASASLRNDDIGVILRQSC